MEALAHLVGSSGNGFAVLQAPLFNGHSPVLLAKTRDRRSVEQHDSTMSPLAMIAKISDDAVQETSHEQEQERRSPI